MSVTTGPATESSQVNVSSAKSLSVCIVSSGTSESLGGLASYMRFLSRRLAEDEAASVCAVGRYQVKGPPRVEYAGGEPERVVEDGLFQTRIIAPVPAYRPLLRQLHHCTSRPALRGAAVATMQRAYGPALRRAIPAGVNVVHYVGTGWELLGFAALAEARRRGAAFTVLPAVHPGEWGDSPLDVAFYNQADAVITLSDHEKQHLVRLGAEERRLHTLGLGPATQGTGNGARFRARHGLGQRPLVLFVGRKDRGKGYHALREAMAPVVAAVPDACLVAIGPDIQPPYPPVPEGALLDLGRADEAEKEDALAACDVFCLPSKSESFGIVYVEAWSYGKPVLGGPAPAVRELVTEGVTGHCVGQDPAQIAPPLIRLLADPALAQTMGQAGRRLQQERYTWDAVTDAHKALFRRQMTATLENV